VSKYDNAPSIPFGFILKAVVFVVLFFFGITFMPKMVEHQDATEVMVVQSLRGHLTWYHTPGYHMQWLGTVTKYPLRSQYWFSKASDQGAGQDQSIKVRFNDGAHATISGSLAWEMPVDDQRLTAIHTRYGNTTNLEQQLVRTITEKAVYMTGPLMSSKESYAERRNELIRDIEDQISNGVYQTETESAKEKDPMTGQEKTVTVVKLIPDSNGGFLRQDESPLKEFGVRTFNLSLNSVDYDPQVEKQITAQQEATMEVQTAIANAKKAEQAAITAAKNGEAEAAKAKWEQEVIKAKAVTQAEQQLEVAKLERQAAEQEKQKQILLGEGEAARRKLVMQADNALDAKLNAYIEVNKAYAAALSQIKQPIVPLVQGGTGGNGQNGVQNFMDLLVAKTARELDVNVAPNQK